MAKDIQEQLLAVTTTEVIQWRRHFHRNPELSYQEDKTSQFIYEKLQSFGGLDISRPTRTSVIARLVGQRPGRVLALRADIDALALQEENDSDYASNTPGVMHACGHDGHAAMLLGAAKVLTQLKDEIQGEIRFIFQHAEEMSPGGAQEIVDAGALDGVDEILGIHLTTAIPTGSVGTKSGPILANCDRFDITINGKGGHSSRPDSTIDPIAIGAQVITNLQHVVSRRSNALEPVVVSITFFHGGAAHNVIPQSAALGGTVRSFDAEVRKQVAYLMEQTVKGITQAHGADYEFAYHYGYGAVFNQPELTAKAEIAAAEVLGKESVLRIPQRMASEDFSSYLTKAPGCFVFLGAGNEQKGTIFSNHHPRFSIDEAALGHGVKLFVHWALTLPRV
jgi:amidohydrolase